MRLPFFALALVSVCSFPALSHAAPLPPQTFYFNNAVLTNGAGDLATVTGNLVIVANYVVAGYSVTSNNFAVSTGGTSYNFVSSMPTFYFAPSPRDNAVDFYFTGTDGGTTYFFNLVLRVFGNPQFNLDGATLCPSGSGCLFHQRAASTNFGFSPTIVYSDITGTLSATDPAATAATPEPASLALLGTGILAFFAATHRKLRRT